jgi:hypothetical protein
MKDNEVRALVEQVRAACVEAAIRGYEEAATSGLCHEGAVEASVGAIRMVDVDALLRAAGVSRHG